MATFTYVKSENNTAGGADPATVSITPASQGNLLVVHAMERSGGDDTNYTISDTGSHTWTKVLGITDSNATTRKTVASWWSTANSTSSITITVDDGTGQSKAVAVEEISSDTSITWTLLGSDSYATAGGTSNVGTYPPTGTVETASLGAQDQALLGTMFIKGGATGDNHDVDFTNSTLTGGAFGETTLWNGTGAYTRLIRSGFLQETSSGTKTTSANISSAVDNTGGVLSLLVFGDSPSADTTPDAFTFTSLTDQVRSSGPYRGTADITGMDAGETMSVTNGETTNDSGATWNSTDKNYVVGQSQVRSNAVTASASYGTTVTAASVTVNGVTNTADFSVTTELEPIPTITSGNTTLASGATCTLTGTNLDTVTALTYESIDVFSTITTQNATTIQFPIPDLYTNGLQPTKVHTIEVSDGTNTDSITNTLQAPSAFKAFVVAGYGNLGAGIDSVFDNESFTVVNNDYALVFDPNTLTNLAVSDAGVVTSDQLGDITLRVLDTNDFTDGPDGTWSVLRTYSLEALGLVEEPFDQANGQELVTNIGWLEVNAQTSLLETNGSGLLISGSVWSQPASAARHPTSSSDISKIVLPVTYAQGAGARVGPSVRTSATSLGYDCYMNLTGSTVTSISCRKDGVAFGGTLTLAETFDLSVAATTIRLEFNTGTNQLDITVTQGATTETQSTSTDGTPIAAGSPGVHLYPAGNAAATIDYWSDGDPVADSIPDQFTFTDITDQAPGSGPHRGTATIAGMDVGEIVEVTNGETTNDGGSTWSSANKLYVLGQTEVRSDTVTASSTPNGTASVTTTVNTVSDTFTVTTANDTTPDQFNFTDLTGQVQSSGPYRGTATLSGMTPGVTMSVTNGQTTNDSGSTWSLTDKPYVAGQSEVRSDEVTASANYNSTNSVTVTVNGISDSFSVTTEQAPADATPDAFTFTNLVDQVANTGPYRGTASIVGMDNGVTVSVTNGETSNDNGATWSSADKNYVSGQTEVRTDPLTSSVIGGASVVITTTVNGVSSTFSVTTADDVVPDQFTFSDLSGQALSSGPYRGEVSVSGLTAGVTMTVTNGETSNDNGSTWSAADKPFVAGQSRLRTDEVTASASYSTASSVTTTLNTISDTFSVTTTASPGSGPILDDITIASNGESLLLTFSEPVSASDYSGFSLTNGSTLTYVSGEDTEVLTYNISPKSESYLDHKLSYTAPAGGISTVGGALPSFSDAEIDLGTISPPATLNIRTNIPFSSDSSGGGGTPTPTPPPVVGGDLVFLTEERLSDIEAGITTPAVSTYYTQWVDDVVLRYTTGATTPNVPMQLLPSIALYLILEDRKGTPNLGAGAYFANLCETEVYAKPKTEKGQTNGWDMLNPWFVRETADGKGYGEVVDGYRNDGINGMRAYGLSVMLTYHWILQFDALNRYFTTQQLSDFAAWVSRMYDLWNQFYTSPLFSYLHIQDSDDQNSQHVLSCLAEFVLPDGAVKDAAIANRDAMNSEVDTKYYGAYNESAENGRERPLVGYQRGGWLPESNSYMAGNTRLPMWSEYIRKNYVAVPDYNTWAADHARWLLYSMLGPVTAPKQLRYNDVGSGSTQMLDFNTWWRLENSLDSPLPFLDKNSQEYQVLRWMWETIPRTAGGPVIARGEYRTMFEYILGASAVAAAPPSTFDWPLHNVCEGYGAMMFRDNLDNPKLQVFTTAPESWMTDHVYDPVGAVEIFWEGNIISQNAASTGAGATNLRTSENNFIPANDFGYPDFGLSNDIGGPLFFGRRGYRGIRQLGYYSSENFAYSGYETSGAYERTPELTQLTRQMAVIHGADTSGIVVVHDRGVNPTNREFHKRTRFNAEPTVDGSWLVAAADGVEHHYLQIESGWTTTTYDEASDLGLTVGYPDSAAHIVADRKFQISEKKTGMDVESLSIQIAGPSGLTRPVDAAISTNNTRFLGRKFSYNGGTYVVVFNKDPSVAVSETVTIDLGEPAFQAKLLITGVTGSFNTLTSGNTITLSPGTSYTANNNVLEVTA